MVVNTCLGRELGRKHASIMLRHRRRQLAAAEACEAAEVVVQQPRTEVVETMAIQILEPQLPEQLPCYQFCWALPEAWMFSASSMVADEFKVAGCESEMAYPADQMQLVPYTGIRAPWDTIVAACENEAPCCPEACPESHVEAFDEAWAAASKFYLKNIKSNIIESFIFS